MHTKLSWRGRTLKSWDDECFSDDVWVVQYIERTDTWLAGLVSEEFDHRTKGSTAIEALDRHYEHCTSLSEILRQALTPRK